MVTDPDSFIHRSLVATAISLHIMTVGLGQATFVESYDEIQLRKGFAYLFSTFYFLEIKGHYLVRQGPKRGVKISKNTLQIIINYGISVTRTKACQMIYQCLRIGGIRTTHGSLRQTK